MLFKNTNITPGIHSFSLEFLFFKNYLFYLYLGFPGGASGKESACQFRRCKRCRFHPWIGKIPWSRKWQFHFLSFVFILFWLLWVFLLPAGLSLVVASGGYFLVAVFGLLIVVVSLATERQL